MRAGDLLDGADVTRPSKHLFCDTCNGVCVVCVPLLARGTPQPAAFVSIAGTSLKPALLEVHLGTVRGW